MWKAITRPPAASMERCELTHLAREPIDLARAREQHRAYCDALAALGVEMLELEPLDDLPDSCFVEDPAIVLDEVAIITRPGAASRLPECEPLAAALAEHRELLRMEGPATLDGGDVLVAYDVVYVGQSARTSHAGLQQLAHLLLPYGYRIKAVEVRGALHLKSAMALVAPGLALVNRAQVDLQRVHDLELIEVDPTEPAAANALLVDDTVLYPAGFPRTAERLAARGLDVRTLDISEFQKAEGALTCKSLLFRAAPDA